MYTHIFLKKQKYLNQINIIIIYYFCWYVDAGRREEGKHVVGSRGRLRGYILLPSCSLPSSFVDIQNRYF
jgi:hypothetical protein